VYEGFRREVPDGFEHGTQGEEVNFIVDVPMREFIDQPKLATFHAMKKPRHDREDEYEAFFVSEEMFSLKVGYRLKEAKGNPDSDW